MAQGVLSFKYEEEKKDTGMTALTGSGLYGVDIGGGIRCEYREA